MSASTNAGQKQVFLEDAGQLRIIVGAHRSFGKSIALAVSLVVTVLLATQFILCTREPDAHVGPFIFQLLLLLAWSIGLSKVLYEYFGTEEFTVLSRYLIVTRRFLGLRSSRRYSLSSITDFTIDECEGRRGRPFRRTVRVHFDGKSVMSSVHLCDDVFPRVLAFLKQHIPTKDSSR